MRRFAVACLAVGVASGAVAQDGSETSAARTPENAQRFLSVMAEQYPIVVTPLGYYHYQHAIYLSFKPVRITATERCASRVEGEVERFYATDPKTGQQVGGTTDLDPVKNAQWLAQYGDIVTHYKKKISPFDVDWSKVTYLEKTPNVTTTYNQTTKSWEKLDTAITIVAGDVTLDFYTPSAELANRILLAMDTLKKACDKTEGLGF